ATTFSLPVAAVEPPHAERSRAAAPITITVLIRMVGRIVDVTTAQPELSDLLERNGVRATPRRLEVLEELARERDDVTAQELWSRLRERDSAAGLATVYRTLAL